MTLKLFIRYNFIAIVNIFLMLSWALLACFLLPSCDNAANTDAPHIDNSTDPTDTDSDSAEDNTNTATFERIGQEALTIRITNNTSEYRYVRNGDLLPRCQYQNEDTWETCRLQFAGDGMEECSELNFETNCCGEQEEDSMVLVLSPGESYDKEWNAALYEENPNHCSGDCTCLEAAEPLAADYRLSITATTSAECAMDGCEIDLTGVLWAFPSGDEITAQTEFTLPTSEKMIEIVINE